jgi:hypothetical protein
MNLDQYLAAQRGPEADTPVMVKVGATLQAHSLNRILYGAPPKESVAKLRQRMADLIVRCVTGGGAVTREQLLGNFEADEIEQHFTAAKKLAGLHRLGGTL